MFVIYIWSEYSSLHGYWTGRFKKTDRVPIVGSGGSELRGNNWGRGFKKVSDTVEGSVYSVLNGESNIPVLKDNINDKSIKLYKSKESAIKSADIMPIKLQEHVSDVLTIKVGDSGYWNRWIICVIDTDNGNCIHKVLSGKILDERSIVLGAQYSSWRV